MGERLPVPPLQFPFSSVGRKVGGYDREATERLFESLATSYERVWLDCEELRRQLNTLRADLANFEDDKQLLADSFITVRESAATVNAKARQEADAMLRKARKRANQIVARAESEARARADRVLAGIKSERSALEEEIERLRVFAVETHRKLSAFLLETLERSSAGNGNTAGLEPTDHPPREPLPG